jgi:predicted alpha/beta superfamily hydrolase
MYRSICLMLTLIFFTACATIAPQSAQTPIDFLPALKGDYFTVDSTGNGRRYHIFVRLPDGYDAKSPKRYPIVYLLDGDSLFPLLAPTHLFLTYDEKLPEAILVGISYGGFDPSINKRKIDFSAPAADAAPSEDGAPLFLAFLKKDLIPTVESRYITDSSKRVLLGQSRAGYFVLWSALEDPDLFWGRIASNPSFTPGRARFFANASPHMQQNLMVIVASGAREAEKRKRNVLEWIQDWSKRPDKPWQVRLIHINDGTHAAFIGETYRQAMLWLFQDAIATKEE